MLPSNIWHEGLWGCPYRPSALAVHASKHLKKSLGKIVFLSKFCANLFCLSKRSAGMMCVEVGYVLPQKSLAVRGVVAPPYGLSDGGVNVRSGIFKTRKAPLPLPHHFNRYQPPLGTPFTQGKIFGPLSRRFRMPILDDVCLNWKNVQKF